MDSRARVQQGCQDCGTSIIHDKNRSWYLRVQKGLACMMRCSKPIRLNYCIPKTNDHRYFVQKRTSSLTAYSDLIRCLDACFTCQNLHEPSTINHLTTIISWIIYATSHILRLCFRWMARSCMELLETIEYG